MTVMEKEAKNNFIRREIFFKMKSGRFAEGWEVLKLNFNKLSKNKKTFLN
jgi:hypothetical protein